MNKNIKLSIIGVMLVFTNLSAFAERAGASPIEPSSNRTVALSSALIVSQRVALGHDELTKYKSLNEQSKDLAQREGAGASKKTKIILGVTAGVVLTGVVIWGYLEAQYAQILNAS